ncbi:hypothetical protein Nepgr_022700 [Nepenthes gracilis]|uniref:Uncharacterized protein n=1 Tax=Nepenthes gracilis TaxID=150966 RepID=A0AAD3T0S7_NEPGR|nr:hypothetical protein Nepgr_022700 [Nepenthes gracilis]
MPFDYQQSGLSCCHLVDDCQWPTDGTYVRGCYRSMINDIIDNVYGQNPTLKTRVPVVRVVQRVGFGQGMPSSNQWSGLSCCHLVCDRR